MGTLAGTSSTTVLDTFSPRNLFPFPTCTPVAAGFPNLAPQTEIGRIGGVKKFSSNRPFKRTHSAQENEAVLLRHLKDYWGHNVFREHQLEICIAALRDRDVLMVAPTGNGKSLCFQLPAITLEYGVTVVVSPIKSLMHDQVNDLTERGIDAMIACKDTTEDGRRRILTQLNMGHPTMRLLYITPESLFTPKYLGALRRAYKNKQLRRLVVDEAHCIDEWGFTFRNTYRSLGDFRYHFPSVPITALTASATKDTRTDIVDTLGMDKDNLEVWVLPVNRPNIFYEVVYRGDARAHMPTAKFVAEYIKRFIPEAKRRNEANGIKGDTVTGIVYCRLTSQCHDVADKLNSYGISARYFHAQMPEQQKADVLRAWKVGEISCVCATVAFGMGIDQPHVRYVIHYNLPRSFEGFYQETGRAGRDRHASRCVLIYSRDDARFLIDSIERDRERLRSKEGSEVADAPEKVAAYRRQLDSARWLQANYVEKVTECRHVQICRYFGERVDTAEEGVLEKYCNGMCDVCVNPAVVRRKFSLVDENIDPASQVIRTEADYDDADFPLPSSHPDVDIGVDVEFDIDIDDVEMSNSLAVMHDPPPVVRSTPSFFRVGTRRAGLARPHGRSALGMGFASPFMRDEGGDGGDGVGKGKEENKENEGKEGKEAEEGEDRGENVQMDDQDRHGEEGEGLDPTPRPKHNQALALFSSGSLSDSTTVAGDINSAKGRNYDHNHTLDKDIPVASPVQRTTIIPPSNGSQDPNQGRTGLVPYSSSSAVSNGESAPTTSTPVSSAPVPGRVAVQGRVRQAEVDLNEEEKEDDGGDGEGDDNDNEKGGSRALAAKRRKLDVGSTSLHQAAPRRHQHATCTITQSKAEPLSAKQANVTASELVGSSRPPITSKSKRSNANDSTDKLDDPDESGDDEATRHPHSNRHTHAPQGPPGHGRRLVPRSPAPAPALAFSLPIRTERTERAFTIDSIIGPGEGGYAVVASDRDARDARDGQSGRARGVDWDREEEKERKRKRQKDAFEAVESVSGDGPFAYYNASPAPAPVAIRSMYTTPARPSTSGPGPTSARFTASAGGARGMAGPGSVSRQVHTPGPGYGHGHGPGPGQGQGSAPRSRLYAHANANANTPNSGARMSVASNVFKTPFATPAATHRAGPILAETRKEALVAIQEAMLGHLDCAVWAYWGIGGDGDRDTDKAGRGVERGIKKVARAVEHDLAVEMYTTTDYNKAVKTLITCLKLLRIDDVVRAICAGELRGAFGQGESGGMMRRVEDKAGEVVGGK